jgi:CrcB protein
LKYVMIGVGGFVGAIARFLIGTYVGNKLGTKFPYGTFVINCTGSFLIGLILTLLTEKTHWNANWRYLIPIGFIGAYTTFSTFEYETARVIQDGQVLVGLLNVTLSVVIGFAAVMAGIAVGRALA